MATKVTIKLTNRSPRKPIKKLPESVELAVDATIEELKKIIARQAAIRDHNRVGLFDPTTGKTFKDRRARVSGLGVGEIRVQDLGPQVAWKTVFLIEYVGPILFHVAAVTVARPYLYPLAAGSAAAVPLSRTQWLGFSMVLAHFLKREAETLFVHRFSAATMPARNIVKNSVFYWAMAGALASYTMYSPHAPAASRSDKVPAAVDYLGLLVFLFGEASNGLVHWQLAGLRTRGGTERGIPRGYGFDLVTCPNYMFEVMSWLGVVLATRDWGVALFIAVGAWQMNQWARQKEQAYRVEFGDRYKKKRWVMLPGLL